MSEVIVVAGGGGFIGGHLVARSPAARASACAPSTSSRSDEWYQRFADAENLSPRPVGARTPAGEAVTGAGARLQPRRRHGRHGLHREQQGALHALRPDQHAHADGGPTRPASSASSTRRRRASTPPRSRPTPDVTALAEADAYPAMPEDGYGWEKLFSERMCRHFREDFGLATRVARYHNVYGPYGTYDGGREKAPAAICRKVVAGQALRRSHEIEIWGDGEQTRSFMYIDDCVHGHARLLTPSDVIEPLNLGSSELVTINQLVSIVEEIAGRRTRAALQARRAAGRARPQQRQHAHPRAARLGAVDQPARRAGADLPLDPRPDGGRRTLDDGSVNA